MSDIETAPPTLATQTRDVLTGRKVIVALLVLGVAVGGFLIGDAVGHSSNRRLSPLQLLLTHRGNDGDGRDALTSQVAMGLVLDTVRTDGLSFLEFVRQRL